MFNKMKMLKQRKTSVVRNSLAITINETFEFPVEEENLQNTYFVIELRDNSVFNKRGQYNESAHLLYLIKICLKARVWPPLSLDPPTLQREQELFSGRNVFPIRERRFISGIG